MSQKEMQKGIWDKHWRGISTDEAEILSSRFTQEAYREIKRFIGNDDKRILEAGCGTGRFCLLLGKDFPHAEITGIDISDYAIRIAENAKSQLGIENVKFEKRDLFSTGYPDNYFDVVFNEGVIEHFSLDGEPTYKDAIHEMVRITKKGGKVIVAVPNYYCLPHTFYKWLLQRIGRQYEYGYERSFKHQELIDLFKEFHLHDIELSAWYPAHGFYRLGRYSRIFSLAGKVVDLIHIKPFIRKFGFEIIIKGVKSK